MTTLAASLMEGISSPVTFNMTGIGAAGLHTKTNISSLILNWVAASPNRRGVHVVLDSHEHLEGRTLPARKREQRKLRNQLLMMGCTVTSRVTFN